MRILLVDDELGLLEQTEIFLKKEVDLDIDTSTSAGKALELFEEKDYDCIVSDYQMPEMDGLEFLETIREEKDSDIPFLIFTGEGREEVAIEALNLGANRYLQKGGDPRSQYGVLAQAIVQEIKHWKHEREFRNIDWLLTKEVEETTYEPHYGDLTELNIERTILDSVGKDLLQDIVDHFMSLLDTSCAVYEKNGDYALGIFASKWCRFMDKKSRCLCNTDDNQEALDCGKWLCHESCWNSAKTSMEKGEPVDVECDGGINLYAVPIRAGGEIIGFINFGYGEPPKDPDKLKELSEKYNVSIDELRKNANSYETRPKFIIQTAKNRLRTSARLIGEIVGRKRSKEKLKKSREEYKSLAENVSDILLRIDPKGSFTYLSRNIESEAGYSPDELVGENIKKFLTSKSYEKAKERIKKWRQGAESLPSYEVTIRTKDGSEKLYELSTKPVFDGDQLEAIQVVARDISERKMAEGKLRESEEKYRKLFESADVGIVVHGPEGEILSANPAAEETLGKFNVCPNCGSNSVVRDYQHNVLICADCGRILKEGIKDRGPEWRAFSAEEYESKNRVGPPVTRTIHDKGLSTGIDWKNKDSDGRMIPPKKISQMYRLRKWNRRARVVKPKDRNLIIAFNEISRMAFQLSLPESTQEIAANIYRKALAEDLIRGRSIEGIVSAALYAACRESDIPRTFEGWHEEGPHKVSEMVGKYVELRRPNLPFSFGVQDRKVSFLEILDPVHPTNFFFAIISEDKSYTKHCPTY